VLGRLKGFNAVDVNQRAMHHPIGFRVGNRDSRFGDRHVFGVPYLMDFAVRKPQDERLERLAPQPFSNRFHVHAIKCTTVDNE